MVAARGLHRVHQTGGRSVRHRHHACRRFGRAYPDRGLSQRGADLGPERTRPFVVGEPTPATVEMHAVSVEALRRSLDAARPGVRGRELYDIACDVFEAAGHPTQRTKTPGETLAEGFYFSLGHGVGLQVHEAPGLGRTGTAPLVGGDVLAVEPGTSRGGEGGAGEAPLPLPDHGA